MTNEDNKKNFNSTVFFAVIITVLIIIATMIVSYAFFQYARIGRSNTLATGQIHVQFVDTKNINIGNAFPIDFDELDNTYESTFTLKVDSEIPEGLRYKVYAEMGDEVSGKNRLDDGVMSILFTAPTDGDGYLTTLNNYGTAKSPAFVNNRALISTGIIENADTTVAAKEYKLSLWIDSDKILVSSTTKRANNEEGFPSLADTSAGNTTALRYIANDDNLVNTTLYPAESEHEGKIVYTTKELSTSYYSIKIGIEIEEVEEDEYLVYFDSQGGSISTESMMVTAGRNYPSLPVPTKEGYTFLGWNGKNMFDGFNGYFKVAQDLLGKTITTSLINSNYFLQLKISHFSGGSPTYTSPRTTNVITITQSHIDAGKMFVINSNYGPYSAQELINDHFMIEEGTEATAYEPYYITSSTKVTQNKDHTLKAIWQPNS